MSSRIGLIGYGAVAAVHAKGLHRSGADLRVVYGSREDKAEAFARVNGIPRATTLLDSVFEECDTVIVASPSHFHFGQAHAVLEAGRHCLIELPACSSAVEARGLITAAVDHNALVQCAHTSRYLAAFARVRLLLEHEALGEIRHIDCTRSIAPRTDRSWTDDAVLHHAAHHIDLILHWFNWFQPVACVAHPALERPQDAVLLGRLESGAPLRFGVSYSSRLPESRVTIIGSHHTIQTDGFSYIRSDEMTFDWKGDETLIYESAIRNQDQDFLAFVEGGDTGTPWNDTLRLAECLDRFLELGSEQQ
ncbi:MAG: Gfo/Idh/MocA family oxidoreductase [Acidobacteria bacterium]|nr:Gfo/Idh/MocA family oxidoreductase [Acidobacteriota bacterium]